MDILFFIASFITHQSTLLKIILRIFKKCVFHKKLSLDDDKVETSREEPKK